MAAADVLFCYLCSHVISVLLVVPLDDMHARRNSPNVITYGAAISACEERRQPERAEDVPSAGIMPNVIFCNATISACEVGRQPERVFWLQEDMPSRRIMPSLITYNATQRKLQTRRKTRVETAAFGLNTILICNLCWEQRGNTTFSE